MTNPTNKKVKLQNQKINTGNKQKKTNNLLRFLTSLNKRIQMIDISYICLKRFKVQIAQKIVSLRLFDFFSQVPRQYTYIRYIQKRINQEDTIFIENIIILTYYNNIITIQYIFRPIQVQFLKYIYFNLCKQICEVFLATYLQKQSNNYTPVKKQQNQPKVNTLIIKKPKNTRVGCFQIIRFKKVNQHTTNTNIGQVRFFSPKLGT
eukprot:TRINITY_DN1480_c0_g1_i12.p2 TRINITY_DN1480_c0_g1~~TRINITY_DN1480_c0_g1_i12.p2  ORF type:complete len:206 (+),score=-12.69 TRINITY_DN1480_c0_g1_i12:757-1374(+)